MFLSSSEDTFKELTDACKLKDAESVKILSHRLKGSAANIFANSMKELALEMEMDARGDDVDAAVEKLPELRSRYDELAIDLKSWKEEVSK